MTHRRNRRRCPGDNAPLVLEVFPSFEQIAQRTYELFTTAGVPRESIFDCWRRAEDELLQRAASRAIR